MYNRNFYDANTSMAIQRIHINSVIKSIEGVWRTSISAQHTNVTYVPPDHNIQLVVSGSYFLKIEEHEYFIKPGSIIYYHKNEKVNWIKNDVSVNFYSIVFTGDFNPLPIDKRVMPADKILIEHFDRIQLLYMQNRNSLNRIQLQSSLLYIIESLYSYFSLDDNSKNSVWLEVERLLILSQNLKPTIEELVKLSGYSESTIKRSCLKCTGVTPMKRVKILRMEKAKLLIQFSSLNITEISEVLQYSRVHEFSREFKLWSGKTPTEYRV